MAAGLAEDDSCGYIWRIGVPPPLLDAVLETLMTVIITVSGYLLYVLVLVQLSEAVRVLVGPI